jgi:hypothetical protein
MSRTPDFTTPVEDMTQQQVIDNLEALLSASIEACDLHELMELHTALGGARYTPTETCDGCGGEIIPADVDELNFEPENGLCAKELDECYSWNIVFMCLDSGIPSIVHMTTDEEEMKQVWIKHLEGDISRPLCDEQEWTVEEGFDKGYFVNHKTEYRLLYHRGDA